MAKIAAILLPASQAGRLTELGGRVSQSLCIGAHHRLEAENYFGDDMACLLLRIAPDPLNVRSQPVADAAGATVVAGYYLTAAPQKGDSGTGLHQDLTQKGVDALPLADGVYAFARWDSRRECLVIGVDKLGIRPLYWMALPGGGYAVASEIKALIALTDQLEPNWSAWEEHLSFGFLFGDHTLLHGIERVGAAEVITFGREGKSRRTVENFLETIEVVDRPLDEFVEEQSAVFDQAMRRLAGLYDAPRDTMLTLSGGFDSRRALAWLLNNDIRPTAYTVPEVRSDGAEYESSVVRALCRAADLEGYAVYPETFSDRAQVRELRDVATDFESDEHQFSLILAAGLRCHDKVNFDGLGAGSQLSGSFVTPEYFEAGGQARFLADLPRSARHWLDLPPLDSPPLAQRTRSWLEQWGDDPNRFAYFYLMSRTRREIALAPHLIQANVFESLCPFLDREMMRSALSFPPERKVGADMQKHFISALRPSLDKVPTVHCAHVYGNDNYRMDRGKNDYKSNLSSLRKAVALRGSKSGWAIGMKQHLKFRAASLKASFGPDPRLRWEFGKAAKVGQLAHFERITDSAQRYRAAVCVLGDTLAQRTDWCQPL